MPLKWLEIPRDGGALSLNWKDSAQDHEELERLKSGMSGFFVRAEAGSPAIRDSVLRFLGAVCSAVGVVAIPGFAADESDFDVVWAVCGALDGLVWNGSGLIAPDGRLLLDGEGNSEFTEAEV